MMVPVVPKMGIFNFTYKIPNLGPLNAWVIFEKVFTLKMDTIYASLSIYLNQTESILSD